MYPVTSQDNSPKKEIYIFSIENFDTTLKAYLKNKVELTRWENLKKAFENSSNYYASADDLVLLAKLASYIHGTNTIISIDYLNGQPHLTMQGSPVLKSRLSGFTKLSSPPIVTHIAIGTKDTISSVLKGGLITVVLVSSFRVLDLFFSAKNKHTLSKFLGAVSTDILKVGISAALSILAVKASTGLAYASTAMTAGPLILAISVGILSGYALNKIDEHYKITTNLQKAIHDMIKNKSTINEDINSIKSAIVKNLRNSGYRGAFKDE